MAKKLKNRLPSGNVRVQVRYTGPDGKSHTKSFTGSTKAEAELLANTWRVNRKNEEIKRTESIGALVESYIDLKENVLSPSTVREYRNRAKSDFDGIKNLLIDDITNKDIQLWVSTLAKTKSPKSVRNIYALLTATLDMFRPEMRVKVTLPAKQKTKLYTPSDSDVSALLNYIHERDMKELEAAVLLGAFGPLRRGEICALTKEDINGNCVTVNKSMVMDEIGLWIIKPNPKTYSSYRTIELPDRVIEILNQLEPGKDGRLFQATPDQITHRFTRAIKFSNSKKFRFHDLRHYSASILHAIGVPDKYIMQRGGWQSDNVLKSVYQAAIDEETIKQTAKINDHFSSLLDNNDNN